MDSIVQATEVRGRIERLDEVLTMSARMAAASGSAAWAARYEEFVPKLDAAIAEALDIATPEIRDEVDRATGEANRRLVELEGQALSLAAAGHLAGATAVLDSPEYAQHKQTYALGMHAFGANMDRLMAERRQDVLDSGTTDGVAAAVGLALLLAAWALLVRTLGGWKRSLLAGSERQKLAEAERLESIAREREKAKAEAEAQRQETLGRLAHKLEEEVGGVVAALNQIAASASARAEATVRSARETSVRTAAVASASAQTSSNVQTVAAAAEELNSAIDEISGQANRSARVAHDAIDQARAASQRVNELAEAGRQIAAVISLIQGIAGQTNLLALNATIEASRAGESGKGFAVVAAEVKALANQTRRATEDIAAQVAGIQGATETTLDDIRAVATIVEQIDGIAASIASAVEEQGAATAEIARTVHHAAAGVDEVKTNAEAVAGVVHETNTASADVLTAASDLARQGSILQAAVERFVADLRAAA